MKCAECGKESKFISRFLGVCGDCLRERLNDALPFILNAHSASRRRFSLPEGVPREGKYYCSVCGNECSLDEGERGFCGVRWGEKGGVRSFGAKKASLSYYYDHLPTNCVADWVCPGGTGAGYPEYAWRNGPELGYRNLAVFFQACNFNCLFCQNWHYREHLWKGPFFSADELVSSALKDDVSCVCYFGGDPGPQLPFAIYASEKMLEKRKKKILRICWETNGYMNEKLLKRMVEISLISGGCVKFDIKAWSESIHIALTGISGKRTKDNFERASERIKERREVPLVIASTLLVPGYIDEKEVRHIARFIASLDAEIPYALLAFYPQFYMSDLPVTPRDLALRCLEAAKEEGLKNVRLGNVHLLV